MTNRRIDPDRLPRLHALALFAAPALAQSPLENPAALREQAPATYKARFDTSKGVFVIEVTRAWAPKGADRFYNLVKNGFYDNVAFLPRDLRLHGAVRHQRRSGDHGALARRADRRRSGHAEQQARHDHVRDGRTRTRAPARCSSISPTIRSLDSMGFAPFGRVVSGMNVVDALNAEYGEGAPRGRGPDQSRLQNEGNAYLAKEFSRAWTISRRQRSSAEGLPRSLAILGCRMLCERGR